MLFQTLLLVSSVQAAFRFPYAPDEEIKVLPSIPGVPDNSFTVHEQEARQNAHIIAETARHGPRTNLPFDRERQLMREVRETSFKIFPEEVRWALGLRVGECMENTSLTLQQFGECLNEAVKSVGQVLNPVLFSTISLVTWAAMEGNLVALEWFSHYIRFTTEEQLITLFNSYLFSLKATPKGFLNLVNLVIRGYKVKDGQAVPIALRVFCMSPIRDGNIVDHIFVLKPTFSNFDIIMDNMPPLNRTVFINGFVSDSDHRGRIGMVWNSLLKRPEDFHELDSYSKQTLYNNVFAVDKYEYLDFFLKHGNISNSKDVFDPQFLTLAELIFRTHKVENIAKGFVRDHADLLSTALRGAETSCSVYMALEMLGDEAFNAFLTGSSMALLFEPLIVENQVKQWVSALAEIYNQTGVPTHQAILEYIKLVPESINDLDQYLADPDFKFHPDVLLKLVHELVIGEITEIHRQSFAKAVKYEATEALAFLVRIHGFDLNEVVVDGDVIGNALRMVQFSAPVLSKMIELGVDMNSKITVSGVEVPVLVFLASRSDPAMSEVLYSYTGYTRETLEDCLPIARSRFMFGLLGMLRSRLN